MPQYGIVLEKFKTRFSSNLVNIFLGVVSWKCWIW